MLSKTYAALSNKVTRSPGDGHTTGIMQELRQTKATADSHVAFHLHPEASVFWMGRQEELLAPFIFILLLLPSTLVELS